MATAELAAAIPVLVLVLTLCLGAVQLGLAQIRCVDAARSGARMLARGEDPARAVALAAGAAPPGAVVARRAGGGSVTVIVSSSAGWLADALGLPLRVSASATAVTEGDLPSAAGAGPWP